MPAPLSKLKKTEIVWLNAHKCRHGHTYLEHYKCYLEENPNRGQIGFFDIEVTNLDADFGFMLSYAIKEHNSDNLIVNQITKKEIQSFKFDKRLVSDCIRDLKKFDRIVTYYGTGFDIPYVRAKALHYNQDFPLYGELLHDDLYYIIKSKFIISRRSLKNACEYLLNDTNKTFIDKEKCMKASVGDEKSLAYIVEHNIYDVIDTEALYNKIIGFKMRSDRSA